LHPPGQQPSPAAHEVIGSKRQLHESVARASVVHALPSIHAVGQLGGD
jgi:hypothetical protein